MTFFFDIILLPLAASNLGALRNSQVKIDGNRKQGQRQTGYKKEHDQGYESHSFPNIPLPNKQKTSPPG